jgi:hypothetical protein
LRESPGRLSRLHLTPVADALAGQIEGIVGSLGLFRGGAVGVRETDDDQRRED